LGDEHRRTAGDAGEEAEQERVDLVRNGHARQDLVPELADHYSVDGPHRKTDKALQRRRDGDQKKRPVELLVAYQCAPLFRLALI